MKFGADIQDSKRLNPTDFGDFLSSAIGTKFLYMFMVPR